MYTGHDIGCPKITSANAADVNKLKKGRVAECSSLADSEGSGLLLLSPPVAFANLGFPPPDAFANQDNLKESNRNEKPLIPAKPHFMANRNMNNNALARLSLSAMNGTAKLKNLMLLREPTRKPSIRQMFSDDESCDSLSDSDDSVDETANTHEEVTTTKDDTVSTSGMFNVSSDSSSSFDQINEDDKGQCFIAKIFVPEQKLNKCMQLKVSETVWTAKQRILQSLVNKLKDPLNYGLFHENAGTFLLDHKPMCEYFNAGSVGSLQMRYKCKETGEHPRNSKEGRRHAKMQSASKRRDFLTHVQQCAIDKIRDLIKKGVDPNFQCPHTGETPLTILSSGQPRAQCSAVFIALMGGGGHLDYRNQRGFTPIHVAARTGNIQMIKTLLEFKASPNVVDGRDMTPLYHCVLLGSDPDAARILLQHGATVGCCDSQGWSELHQACRYGRFQLLELLLNCDAVDHRMVNARNASGNTPLHVCALYNQEECAMMLMMHGADAKIVNFSNQDAVQVAHITPNVNVAQLIKEYPSRKEGVRDALMKAQAQATSDSLAMPPPREEPPKQKSKKKHGRSTWTPSSLMKHSKQFMLQKQHSVSGSLGRSKEKFVAAAVPVENRFDSKLPPNARMPDVKYPKDDGEVDENKVRMVVRDYDARTSDELTLRTGSRVIVLNARSAPPGYQDGMVDGQRGFFPQNCVEEVQLRRPLPDTGQRAANDAPRDQHGKAKNSAKRQQHGSGVDKTTAQRTSNPDSISLASFGSSDDMHSGSAGRTPSVRSDDLAHFVATSTPGVYHNTRDVLLWKGNAEYGFILRGTRSDAGPLRDSSLSATNPGHQYLQTVEDHSNAYNAGLRNGDFIIKIGEIDVRRYGHEQLVETIRSCGDPLHLLVTTVAHANRNGDAASSHSSPTARKVVRRHVKNDSISSAIGQLDNVLDAAEYADLGEHPASLRGIPGRKPGGEHLQNLFRENATVNAIATLPRQPQQSSFSSSRKPIRVLPPSVLNKSPLQHGQEDTYPYDDDARSVRSLSLATSNPSTFTTWGRSAGPPPPYAKEQRAHSVSGATGERLLVQSGARSKKVPPPLPKRMSSRLTVPIPEEEPVVKSPPIFTAPSQTTKTPPHTAHVRANPANTQADMAAVIALAARNRAERMSQSEKEKQHKEQEKLPTPPELAEPVEESSARSVAEMSSALSLALAAKQKSLGHNRSDRPASFKATLPKSQIVVRRSDSDKNNHDLPPPFNLPPPPPPSGNDDIIGLDLPPPPDFPELDSLAQSSDMSFDELMLPPPPLELLTNQAHVPRSTKPPDPTVKPARLGFLPPPPIPPPAYDDEGCASPNGTDNLSNADSGVADVTGDGLAHRTTHHDHVSGDNYSTVSNASTSSTVSSEDAAVLDSSASFGERAWPLREVRNPSRDDDAPANPAGSMYLNVLKKAKNKQQQSQTPPAQVDAKKGPRPAGVAVTKMTFAPVSALPPPGPKAEPKPLFPIQKVSFAPPPKSAEKPPAKSVPLATPATAKKPACASASGKVAPSLASSSGDGVSTTKPLAQWTVADVCVWLEELGLQSYTSSFKENQITGEHLPSLGKDGLIELGVKPFGHRLTIDRSIKKLSGA